MAVFDRKGGGVNNSMHDIGIAVAQGGHVYDGEKSYIDFTSGIFAASLGMHNSKVAISIDRQANRCMHAYQFDTPVRGKYLESLKVFTGYESAYMFSSGTESTEAAWKIARLHTGRHGIWGLTEAFHGKTLGAQIAAGKINDIRSNTGPEETGCLIFEPYVARTAKLHPPQLIDNIKRRVKEHDLILIADEIQAGFFRTGKLFGYQHYPDLKPDLVCIGKAMTNGFPASAVLGPSHLIDNPRMDLSSTNGGNPLACAAGLSVIEQMVKPEFIDRLAENIEIFGDGLKKLPLETEQIGMVAAIFFEYVDDADAAVVKLKDAGLLVVHTKANTIKLGPPLNIQGKVLRDGLNILKEVLG